MNNINLFDTLICILFFYLQFRHFQHFLHWHNYCTWLVASHHCWHKFRIKFTKTFVHSMGQSAETIETIKVVKGLLTLESLVEWNRYSPGHHWMKWMTNVVLNYNANTNLIIFQLLIGEDSHFVAHVVSVESITNINNSKRSIFRLCFCFVAAHKPIYGH